MTELTPGRVIAGRYRLEHRLGEGGMGAVWSAQHLELRSRVAVKLIVPRHVGDPDMLSRFIREARAAAALRSPHVVQIFDSGIDDGLAFIVMEQLEGETLAQRLERESRLSPELTATIVTHVARAVSRAHAAHLVHRDLKPDNIFLVQNEDELVAKVLDFGIAKLVTDEDGEPPSTRTATGKLIGSPCYMSPEQTRGRTVDFRSDLWAIGVLTYECLLGERPFQGSALGEIILAICTDPLPIPSAHGSVPEGFDAWFARATARDPNERFASARELAIALRRTLHPEGAAYDSVNPASDSDAERVRQPAALGSTTGEPTASEAARSGMAGGRYFPALIGALIAMLITLGVAFALRPEPVYRAATGASSTQAARVGTDARPLLAAPPAPTSAVSEQASEPARATAAATQSAAGTQASPAPSSRPRAAAHSNQLKTALSATPSTTARVAKDPLSSRF
jgi:hypothetical protein